MIQLIFEEIMQNEIIGVDGGVFIATSKGNRTIKELLEENSKHQIWNGSCMSEATFRKTGTAQQLFEVATERGNRVKCTDNHKFVLMGTDPRAPGRVVRVKDLKVGDIIKDSEFVYIDTEEDGVNKIKSITQQDQLDDTYIFTVDKQQGVFNGILLSSE